MSGTTVTLCRVQTGRIIAAHGMRCIGFTFVIHVHLQNFTGGDGFGRLALAAGNGFRRTGNSQYQLPSDRSGGLGPANQSGTVLFGTWVGSGHQFGMRAAANDNVRFSQALPRRAPMWSCGTRPHPP
jgi:hypothetical protein